MPLYIGESVSSLIPSVVVFIQGSTNHETHKCDIPVNSTQIFLSQNHSIHSGTHMIEPVDKEPGFSVSIYFLVITVLMMFCSISFIIVDKLYANEYKQKLIDSNKETNLTKENDPFIMNPNSGQPIDQNDENLKKITLLVIAFFVTFFMYGILPGTL